MHILEMLARIDVQALGQYPAYPVTGARFNKPRLDAHRIGIDHRGWDAHLQMVKQLADGSRPDFGTNSQALTEDRPVGRKDAVRLRVPQDVIEVDEPSARLGGRCATLRAAGTFVP